MSSGVGMQQWKPYHAYKDSGVEWLGQVPQGWEVKRLRFLIHINPARSEISLQPGSPVSFVPMEAVGEYGGMLCQEKDEIETGYSYFIDKDVLIAKITPCFENGKGALAEGLTNGVGFGSTEFHVVRSLHGLLPLFLFYFSISYYFRKLGEAFMYGAGGQKRIPDTFIRNFFFPISSVREQQAIASFLDHECGRIDTLIEKKRRLLELLEEKRRAVITQAVTRGLDPSAPMKDSGVEWLGQVPQGWEVKRLKFCVSSGFQYGANIAAELDDPTLPRYIRITDMNDDGTLKDDTFRSLTEEDAAAYLLQDNDILLARSGATVGKSFIYHASMGAAAYAGYLIKISPAKDVTPSFLYAFLNSNSYWQWVRSIFIQATIQNVSAEKYANLCITVPPLPDQQAIVDHLDAETAAIDAQRQAHEKSIALLQEYRASLITHAVTGKIDVREYAPQQ